MDLIGIVITLIVAAVVYWLALALGLPSVIALIAALLVLLAALGGVGSHWR